MFQQNSVGKINNFAHIQKGWETIGGKRYYFKSKLEKNYAKNLQLKKEHGKILDWFYEPKIFWFESIKRGTRTYLPDFQIIENNGTYYWVECKGYFDSRSKTKLKRFSKYYPSEKIVIVRNF